MLHNDMDYGRLIHKFCAWAANDGSLFSQLRLSSIKTEINDLTKFVYFSSKWHFWLVMNWFLMMQLLWQFNRVNAFKYHTQSIWNEIPSGKCGMSILMFTHITVWVSQMFLVKRRFSLKLSTSIWNRSHGKMTHLISN